MKGYPHLHPNSLSSQFLSFILCRAQSGRLNNHSSLTVLCICKPHTLVHGQPLSLYMPGSIYQSPNHSSELNWNEICPDAPSSHKKIALYLLLSIMLNIPLLQPFILFPNCSFCSWHLGSRVKWALWEGSGPHKLTHVIWLDVAKMKTHTACTLI